MIDHNYVTNCQEVNGVYQVTMQFLTAFYFAITVVWAVLCFKTYGNQTHQLQRGLVVIPAMKCLMSLMQFTYVSQCPWQDSV